jgi:hypothetical protein
VASTGGPGGWRCGERRCGTGVRATGTTGAPPRGARPSLAPRKARGTHSPRRTGARHSRAPQPHRVPALDRPRHRHRHRGGDQLLSHRVAADPGSGRLGAVGHPRHPARPAAAGALAPGPPRARGRVRAPQPTGTRPGAPGPLRARHPRRGPVADPPYCPRLSATQLRRSPGWVRSLHDRTFPHPGALGPTTSGRVG